jgi:hypothetical protein
LPMGVTANDSDTVIYYIMYHITFYLMTDWSHKIIMELKYAYCLVTSQPSKPYVCGDAGINKPVVLLVI